MQVELTTVKKLRLTDLDTMDPFRLDPVTVILEDFEHGKGKIIIECFGQSWSAFWGAMGDSVATFFCRCDEHYLAKNLSSIRGDIPDYEKLADVARKEVIQFRRDGELTKNDARGLFDQSSSLADAENAHELDHRTMKAIFGDEWWHCIPDKPNPDYQYLCRVIKAVQAGIRAAGLLDGGKGDSDG